jgi:hypothetical protein
MPKLAIPVKQAPGPAAPPVEPLGVVIVRPNNPTPPCGRSPRHGPSGKAPGQVETALCSQRRAPIIADTHSSAGGR